MSDEEPFCAVCGTHFTSADTLAKHCAAFHKAAPAAAPPAAPEYVAPNLEDGSNLEIAPLLTVLTPEQKDLLLLRAIHKAPSLVGELITSASTVLTPEAARARVEELRGDAGVPMVRAYTEIGSLANALALLVALTEAMLDALEELLDVLPTSAGGSGSADGAADGEGASWENSDELRAVEDMPAAGTLAALWSEVVSLSGARRLSDDDELLDLLQNVQVHLPPRLRP